MASCSRPEVSEASGSSDSVSMRRSCWRPARMRSLWVVGRERSARTHEVSAPLDSRSARRHRPNSSSPVTPTMRTAAPRARRMAATFPAPPGLSARASGVRGMVTTGMGASGEMRLTLPKTHSSIMRSPTRSRRMPADFWRSSLARFGFTRIASLSPPRRRLRSEGRDRAEGRSRTAAAWRHIPRARVG